MESTWQVRPLGPEHDAALLAFLGDEAAGRGFCFCTAWWTASWDEFRSSTPAGNRAMRERLLARGERDGYLLVDGDAVVGWAQCGLRERLPKLGREYPLPPDPGAYAITCFEIAPSHRGRGAARFLLEGILADLRARGVPRVEGFPRPGRDLDPGQAWTGPEALFRGAGFREESRGARGPVLVIEPLEMAADGKPPLA